MTIKTNNFKYKIVVLIFMSECNQFIKREVNESISDITSILLNLLDALHPITTDVEKLNRSVSFLRRKTEMTGLTFNRISTLKERAKTMEKSIFRLQIDLNKLRVK